MHLWQDMTWMTDGGRFASHFGNVGAYSKFAGHNFRVHSYWLLVLVVTSTPGTSVT